LKVNIQVSGNFTKPYRCKGKSQVKGIERKKRQRLKGRKRIDARENPK